MAASVAFVCVHVCVYAQKRPELYCHLVAKPHAPVDGVREVTFEINQLALKYMTTKIRKCLVSSFF